MFLILKVNETNYQKFHLLSEYWLSVYNFNQVTIVVFTIRILCYNSQPILEIKKINKIPLIFEYESLGKNCVEHGFISYVEDDIVILNEENIDYKWCNIDEFIRLIKWYYDKEKLFKILNNLT